MLEESHADIEKTKKGMVNTLLLKIQISETTILRVASYVFS